MSKDNHLKKVCFLDMDGVLVDFVKGCLDLFDPEQKKLQYKDVRWSFYTQLGFTEETQHLFWNEFGEDFWANLELYEQALEVIKICEEYFKEEVYLLSSPVKTHGCLEGKRRWIKKYLPHYERKTFFGSHKQAFAGKNKYLVDDHEENMEKFLAHGGAGTLFPRPWNYFSCLCDDRNNIDLKIFEKDIQCYFKYGF